MSIPPMVHLENPLVMISYAVEVDPYSSQLGPAYVHGFSTTAAMASIAEVSNDGSKSFGRLKG